MFGTQINSKPELLKSQINKAIKLNYNIVQLFVHTNPKYSQYYDSLNKYLVKKNIKCVVHISYTINLCKNWNKYSWWVSQLESEIIIAHKIGAIGIVIHLGKLKDLSLSDGLDNMYLLLLYIHNKTLQYSLVKIFIETSSGQKSEICWKLKELAMFYNKLSHIDRFGICVDTCHIFVSGIDIRTKSNIKKFLKLFDKLIGIEHIKLIHLNDSKNILGSKIDRHETIGNGHIGFDGLDRIKNIFLDKNIPIIME